MMYPLTLCGVTVNFPFPPYDCQKDFMSKVIECLQKKVNGILESPTGTGKTLCLLCATLAWREHFKDTLSAHKIKERLGGKELFESTPLSSWCTASTDNTTACYTEVPKIIYASRTHSQLAQVINELKNTSYRPKVCVLGSREQLCVNQEVLREESNHVKVHMCRKKVSTRSCIYYNNTEEKVTDRDLSNSILDVEDLVKFGNKHRVCPYYLSRSLKQQADVIFMPYNYLLDLKSRKAHNIALNGAVVLFDEAHNLEKTCEEVTSFDLTPYDLASAINVVDRLLVEQAKDVSHGESVTEDFNVESSNGLKMDLATIAKIKQILLDLEAAIDSYDVSHDKGITKPGIFIYDLLERAHLTYSSKAAVSDTLEQIIGHLAGQTGVFVNTSGLQKLADILQLVFSGEPSEKDQQQLKQFNTAHFKVHIHRDTSHHHKKHSTDMWASSSSKKQGNILSYWCFSPGFSMQDLVNQGVHCIILTSGTLSPLSSFTSEMRIEFPVVLENSHVIERDQIFLGIIGQGPDGVQLSSAFDRRFAPENMTSLGNTIVNLCRVVPHGLLVFFPSFPLMEKTLDFWKTNGHADRIETVKQIFVEPKGKGNFTEVIDGYYNKVNDPVSKGGTFFAVCRGKASEGLDFADSFGRGVIITGLPFPPKMDPRVILKMQFLDEKSSKKPPGIKYLSGQQWYKQQAFRAVNQAIGRVIRHRNDFGAIFLCDQRFKTSDAMAQLPSWLRPCVHIYDSFGNVVRDVSRFFRIAQKMRPVVKKTSAENCELPETQLSDFTYGSLSPSSHIHKAKVLDTHFPSMKRRRLNELTGASGMANMCIEYECGDQQSLKRPVNLLDALEQGDHSSRKDNNSDILEKANSMSQLSSQYGKRMDKEFQGGKRKITVVQELEDVPEEGKASMARTFLAGMKKTLSQVNFNRIVQALQSYKTTDNLEVLLTETAFLSEDTSTQSLLRGIYHFIRPHHKRTFDEKCKDLTGHGCGYKPNPSLTKDKDKITMMHSAVDDQRAVSLSSSCTTTSTCTQLNTQQLNQGGKHLNQQRLRNPEPGSFSNSEVHSSFFENVKKALGPEKMSQLFQAINSYKKTDNYENLVMTVVSLFTEKDEDLNLLIRFGIFIRPHHKRQYEQMVDALRGKCCRFPPAVDDLEDSVSHL